MGKHGNAAALRAWLWALAAALLAAALAVASALATAPAQAYAAGDAYQYTVRVLGGNEGTVSDAMAEQTVAYGERVNLDKAKVTLNDGSKYYVKGFRLSGQDDLYIENFTVTEDMDFVVAYGVQGDMVPYTLHFVEYETGTVLADPVTYYGNVGDKPVASFEYIEGYRPLYRNITGTLQASDNDFTFEYVALAEGETEDGGTTTIVQPGTTTNTTTPGTTTNVAGGTTTTTTAGAAAGTAAGAAAGAAAGGEGEEAEGGDENAGAGDNANAADNEPVEPVGPPATEEILDTDNPLAQSAGGEGAGSASVLEGASTDTGIPQAVFWAVGLIVVAAAVAFAIFFYRRRKQREEQEEHAL